MFEAVELGRKIASEEFAARQEGLRTQLTLLQQAARVKQLPIIIVVAGVEGAGKGEVIHQLNDWFDPRGVHVHGFREETDEERSRPAYWRYWRCLPPRGEIAVLFGSWYTMPIVEHAQGRMGDSEIERHLVRIREFERMLSADGALVVKFWFHISRKEQRGRLKNDVSARGRDGKRLKIDKATYRRFLASSELAIRGTDSDFAPWYLIEAHDRHFRDLSVAETLLQLMGQRLADPPVNSANSQEMPDFPENSLTILDRVDLTQALPQDLYERKLQKRQTQLGELAWRCNKARHSVVLLFEGWDAAGKGGAIRRLTYAIDPRLFQTIRVAAPTDEERAHHYLWRFWRHVPRDGYFTLYDRSWYGRLLVERVEGFAKTHEWQRAYAEINEFESQLIDHGTVLSKFWMHIDADEQLKRFRERESTPSKQYKIGPDDWRNREKWNAYERAANDMISRTSSSAAPWTLIAANDKKMARISVLDAVCKRLEEALD